MVLEQRVVDTAWALFIQHGYAQVTMDDIASALGISKRTLYTHISSKEDLLHQLVMMRLQEAETQTKQIATATDLSAYDKLRQLLEYALSQLGAVQPLLFADIQKFLPETWQLIESTRNQIISQQTRAIITQGIAQSEFRDDIAPDLIETVLYHSLRGVITGESPLANPLRFVQLLQTTITLLYEGLKRRD